MKKFDISYLDHVAIRVKDLDASALWYEEVLGMSRANIKEWEPYPVFMLSGRCGVALFPAPEGQDKNKGERYVRIDHFAFNVTNGAFEKAVKHYESLELNFKIQDHIYFKSVYTRDPDGHTVELTTLIVPEESFYP